MPTQKLHEAIRHTLRVVAAQSVVDLTDAQLLDRFLRHRDESAFAALVRRHSALVLGVCRRILGDPHDADDAFQATFLVLVRKAGTLDPARPVGPWLFGVAYRVALKARTLRARRNATVSIGAVGVSRLSQHPISMETNELISRDLRAILDEELNRLPDKYRVPLVLCYLQGKTNEKAAAELGWPIGSMSRRLAKARELLRNRLTQRGIALSVGGLSTALTQATADAAVSTSLIVSTTEAAATFAVGDLAALGAVSASVAVLTKGALTAMYLTKIKIATAILLAVSVAGTGGGIVLHQSLRADGTNTASFASAPSTPAEGKASLPSTPISDDLKKLQGTWLVTAVEKRGTQQARSNHADLRWRFQGDTLTVEEGADEINKTAIKINSVKTLKEIDFKHFLGVYELNGDDLKICYGKSRPSALTTHPDQDARLYILKRELLTAFHLQEQPAPSVRNMPPVVVKTVPQAGDTQVDASKTTEIVVTFSKEMTDKTWSWSQISDETFPEIVGQPSYDKDARTCTAKVKLKPGMTYVVWLNSQKFRNFKDADGQPAVPYLLVFETKP